MKTLALVRRATVADLVPGHVVNGAVCVTVYSILRPRESSLAPDALAQWKLKRPLTAYLGSYSIWICVSSSTTS